MIFLAVAALSVLIILLVALHKPNYLLPLGLVLGLMLARPGLVGERAPWLGPIVLLTVAGVALASKRAALAGNKATSWPILTLFLAYLWLLLREALVHDDAFQIVTSSLTVFLPLFVFGVVALKRPELIERTRSALIITLTALAASTTATLLLGLITSFSLLRLGVIPIGYENTNTGLFFPFTFSYGTGSGTLPRFLGLSREPGMAAIFYGWAFFAIPRWKRRNLCRIFIIIALAGTQSTAGIGIFGLTWILYTILGSERFRPALTFATLVVGSALVWSALYNPTFGYLSKQDQISNSDRLGGARTGLFALMNHPFTSSTDAPLSSINLIAGIAVTGAPWFFLMLLFLTAPCFAGRRTGWQTYSGGLVAATLLTSQPLLGSTALFALSFLTYYSGLKGEQKLPMKSEPDSYLAPLATGSGRTELSKRRSESRLRGKPPKS